MLKVLIRKLCIVLSVCLFVVEAFPSSSSCQMVFSDLGFEINVFDKLVRDMERISKVYGDTFELNEQDTQSFNVEYLKVIKTYLLPVLRDKMNYGSKNVLITFVAPGSAGKSALLNAIPFNLNEYEGVDRTAKPEHAISPVDGKAGYTVNVLSMSSKNSNPEIESRLKSDNGVSPIPLEKKLASGEIGYDHENFMAPREEFFYVQVPEMYNHIYNLDTPGVNNDISSSNESTLHQNQRLNSNNSSGKQEKIKSKKAELSEVSKRAIIRSDVLFLYVNQETAASADLAEFVRGIMEEFGRKKLIFCFRMAEGTQKEEFLFRQIDSAEQSLNRFIFNVLAKNPAGEFSDDKAEQEKNEKRVIEENQDDILGLFFVPHGSHYVVHKNDVFIDKQGYIHFYTDQTNHIEFKTHPKILAPNGQKEFKALYQDISRDPDKVRLPVQKNAKLLVLNRSKQLLERAKAIRSQSEFTLNVYKSIIGQKVVSAFKLFPMDEFKEYYDGLWAARHKNGFLRSTEVLSYKIMHPIAAIQKRTGKNSDDKTEVQGRFNNKVSEVAGLIISDSQKFFGLDTYTIQFRKPDTNSNPIREKTGGVLSSLKKSFDSLAEEEAQVGLSYEDLEFAEEMAILPMTPFFENPRNYEYNYQFIKRNGEVAKSAAEAHDWVTSGAKVEFQVLDYVKKMVSRPQMHDENIKKAVKLVYDTIYYQGRAFELKEDETFRNTIDPYDLQKYIRSLFSQKVDSKIFKQFENELNDVISELNNDIVDLKELQKKAKKSKNKNETREIEKELAEAKNAIRTAVQKKSEILADFIAYNVAATKHIGSIKEQEEFKEKIRSEVYNRINKNINKINRIIDSNSAKIFGIIGAGKGIALLLPFLDPSLAILGAYAAVCYYTEGKNTGDLRLVLQDWYRAKQVEFVDQLFYEYYLNPLETKLGEVVGVEKEITSVFQSELGDQKGSLSSMNQILEDVTQKIEHIEQLSDRH